MKKLYHPKLFIRELIEEKTPFQLLQTMFTKKIKTENETYFYSDNTSGIKKAGLAFITAVKRYFEKNPVNVQIDRNKIRYIHLPFTKNYTKRHIYEIDLNSAYWEFCYKAGFIDAELYEKGKKVDKKVRLMALGNLAKRTAIINFDGENFSDVVFQNSEQTENIFFYVSYLTDLTMHRLSALAGNDFLAFWCDAIFVKNEATKNKLCAYLESEEIPYKVLLIDKIKKKDNLLTVWDGGEKRYFYFRKKSKQINFKKDGEET